MGRNGFNLLRGLVLPSLLVAMPRLAAASVTAGDQLTEALVEIRLNGEVRPGATVVLLDAAQGVYLSRQDFDRWSVQVPNDVRTIRRENRDYVESASVRGLSVRLDSQSQRLELQTAPELVPATTFRSESSQPTATRSPPGCIFELSIGVGSGPVPGRRGRVRGWRVPRSRLRKHELPRQRHVRTDQRGPLGLVREDRPAESTIQPSNRRQRHHRRCDGSRGSFRRHPLRH